MGQYQEAKKVALSYFDALERLNRNRCSRFSGNI